MQLMSVDVAVISQAKARQQLLPCTIRRRSNSLRAEAMSGCNLFAMCVYHTQPCSKCQTLDVITLHVSPADSNPTRHDLAVTSNQEFEQSYDSAFQHPHQQHAVPRQALYCCLQCSNCSNSAAAANTKGLTAATSKHQTQWYMHKSKYLFYP